MNNNNNNVSIFWQYKRIPNMLVTHALSRKCPMLVSSSLSITITLLSRAFIHFLNRLACARAQRAGARPSRHWKTFMLTFTPTGIQSSNQTCTSLDWGGSRTSMPTVHRKGPAGWNDLLNQAVTLQWSQQCNTVWLYWTACSISAAESFVEELLFYEFWKNVWPPHTSAVYTQRKMQSNI